MMCQGAGLTASVSVTISVSSSQMFWEFGFMVWVTKLACVVLNYFAMGPFAKCSHLFCPFRHRLVQFWGTFDCLIQKVWDLFARPIVGNLAECGIRFSVTSTPLSFSSQQTWISCFQVLHRWQAPLGMAACCRTVCSGTSAGTTWKDCCTCFNLLEDLHEQPRIANVIKWAVGITVELSKTVVATQQQTAQQVLTAQMLELPAYARMALLKDGKLNYQGMLALLSSDEQIADSEDDLALLLVSYMQGEAGKACSLFETNTLQDQLRFQHMSGAFFAFKLPSIPQLALNSRELSFLMYLAKIKGPVALPLDFSVPAFPQAWYKPARKLAHATKCGHENFFQITFNISESELSDHLKAAALILAGGATPSTLRSKDVMFRGISWIMSLQSMANGNVLLLAVQPILGADVGIEAGKCGIYVDVTLRLDSAHPIITSTTQPMWSGLGGRGYNNFVQQFGKRPGDPTDLNWWKDYITDGHVQFSATVKLL